MSSSTVRDNAPHQRCPVDHTKLATRKTAPHPEPVGRPLEQDPQGTWHVRGYAEAKAVLRGEGTKQSGFGAETFGDLPSAMTPPVLFREGEAHHESRTQTAKFFTPATTSKRYRGLMEDFSDALIAEFKREGRADLSSLSMALAVQVAAQVVGLTNSRNGGMAGRLETFFAQGASPFRWRPRAMLRFAANQWRLGKFYWMDVRPAVEARRKTPQEDVISHLLEQNYSDPEILTECLTYGAAGMVTTREFIGVAAWHFLERPDLREQYGAADEKTRVAMLHEILRLEPVVGRLYRRTTQPLTLESEGEKITLPAGAPLELHIYAINADASVVGEAPLQLCPARETARGVPAPVMSFGDGHHRCPGAYIAIQETDIFLTRLLALPVVVEREPDLSWNEVTKGYELRNFRVRLEG